MRKPSAGGLKRGSSQNVLAPCRRIENMATRATSVNWLIWRRPFEKLRTEIESSRRCNALDINVAQRSWTNDSSALGGRTARCPRIAKRVCLHFWPILTAASWRMKPGGRPCLERISNQPLLTFITLSFVFGPMLAISAEFSLGPV